jgi:hypothetical protein
MERTYRLEFNEEHQQFHLDNFNSEEGTFGWVTIFDYCTDFEYQVFEAFINRVPNKKLTIEYLLKSAIEIKGFMSNLLEYNIMPVHKSKIFDEAVRG